MRIVGGRYKGTALAAVGHGDLGAHLRPTTDRVRETMFNILAHGGYDDPITDARVLDLFAGSGALGLEALSRGAAVGVFVDNGAMARRLITQNIDYLRLNDQAHLYPGNATRLGTVKHSPFDLVFLDPPYGKKLGGKALSSAAKGGWLTNDALIVWEENAAQPAPDGFALLDTRKFGETHITILRYSGLE